MALALRLADAFAAHRTAGGPTIPAPGRLTPSWHPTWATAAVVALLLAGGAHNMRTNIYYLA